MKRIFAILFAAMLASQAWAYDFQSGDLYYNITGDNTAEVTRENSTMENYKGLTSVEIPETVSFDNITYTVTRIGERVFFCCSGLTSVAIPNSVTSIGFDAFRGCTNLTSINIPNSIEVIDYQAFASCENLTSITIPNGVTTIGRSAFIDCNGLTSVTIPSSVSSIGSSPFGRCNKLTEIKVENGNANYTSDNGVLFDKDMTTIICYPAGKIQTKYDIPESVKTIGESTFIGCNNLTTVTIPEGVVDISQYAFQSCKSLESISIPGSVKSIGYGAFAYCYNLKSVTMSEGLETIDRIAFEGCSSLISVTIPSSVTSIGDEAFLYVNNIVNLSDVTSTGGANSCTFGKDFKFSKDGKTIIEYYGSDGVVYIPSTVTTIGENAFQNHTEIESVYIPNSVESIGADAFAGCTGLISIEIPESVTNMARDVFGEVDTYVVRDGIRYHVRSIYGVEVVKKSDVNGYSGNVVIPESISIGGNTYEVTSIGEEAFYNCNNLMSVIIPNTITTIGYQAFAGCKNLKSIEIPNTVTTIGIWTFGNSGLQSFTIPPSVASIGESAFYGCKDLTSIDISNSVKSIGSNAFAYSGLKSVYIANSVTYVDPMAFYGCNIKTLNYNTNAVNSQFAHNSSLKTVNIGDLVTEIAFCAFQNCTYLTKVNIGKSVEKIGDYAFKGCSSLSSIDIPESVEYIGEGAFEGTKVNLKQENGNEDVLYEIRDGAAVVTGYKSAISGKVTIPSTVTIDGTQYEVVGIAANAFSGCQTIESVTIGDLVETIGECAFCNCHSIREVIIGKSVETIGNKAFRGCHKLRSVEVPSQVSSIGEDAFLYVKNVDYYGGADGAPWSALTLNGTKDGDFIYSDAQMTNLTAYIGDGGFAVIPKGVTSIGFMSFFESDNLESVSIPNTVTSIGGSAFANCFSLKTINVPLSVQMISRAAFRDCRSAVIYCEAPSQPYSWHKEWSYKANNILWGQTNPPVAINDEQATGVVIYAEGRTIVVENATDEISVYDAMGRIVGRDVARNVCTIAINKPGVYIVKTGATAQRVIVNY